MLVKYNSSGTPQWAVYLPTLQTSGTASAVTDLVLTSSSIFIFGRFVYSTTFSTMSNIYLIDSDSFSQSNSSYTISARRNINTGSFSAFLIQYSKLGKVVGSTFFDGSSNFTPNSIITTSNSIYLSGSYTSITQFSLYNASNTSQISSAPITLPYASGTTIPFLLKYSIS
jgi:hypothetical protein